MDPELVDTPWIWHSEWQDHGANTAGGIVHFRKSLNLEEVPQGPSRIQITADTRYKLFINGHNVFSGPVKGDEHLWFYDEIDIQPCLKTGVNHISVRVLRFFHATQYATSFPRLPIPGLFIRPLVANDGVSLPVRSDSSWEAAIDSATVLRIDQKEDDFLHIYEDVDAVKALELDWVAAKQLELPASHGITPPWVLALRMIPKPTTTSRSLAAVHNVKSGIEQASWESFLKDGPSMLRLPAGTHHHIELEADNHLTAMLALRFRRPETSGSTLRIRYSEAYEDEREFVPYIRRKGDRRDTTKALFGPEDKYIFAGSSGAQASTEIAYSLDAAEFETFSPFHFRTLRFTSIDIQVDSESDLEFVGITIDQIHYPLDIKSEFTLSSADEHQSTYQCLWDNSVRTLTNCMHDCCNDCPFYEQLQYAMEVRSSCLFTYAVSGDDRMARQAIVQLYNSYRPSVGLIASRSPAHVFQVIPHFSLFWICTVADHFTHYGDGKFTRKFLAVCDGILAFFAHRLDNETGLISSDSRFIRTHWDFVDWTTEWRPMGIPTAAQRTGTQTFTNFLYAYTLKAIAKTVKNLGRPALAQEYESRADDIVSATQKHCRVGTAFTDGLAAKADHSLDFSQHNQIWAVLCGATSGEEARQLLTQCFDDDPSTSNLPTTPGHLVKFTKASTAMSFYALRALSKVGGDLYDTAFHSFWDPWRHQLGQNLTTWCEDEVTLRSDCHAWSSVPLYEFTAEVAGIKPLEPGWGAISCAPRFNLFGEFDAKVALGGKLAPGIARIRWSREGGTDELSLSIVLQDIPVEDPIRVSVKLSSGVEEHFGRDLTFNFQLE
ncbi:Six-hairpin glycosidase-like protein [Colletotrichum phormii]|uniref:Six-hairpin glycosidase-like protein n=1 Tax=Colletotrichum phormii TaxID=359342 RepID=A0AAJ0E9C8_9PEZI|nr:Six-hairpin glycosidase-like protein [Colletotrichum phormii]KAK1623789.1 Six-hairpin glycosidase-like protein [Colletotrichum phormii]